MRPLSDPLASTRVIALCVAVIATGFARLAYMNAPLDPRVEVRARPPAYEQELLRLSTGIPLDGRVGYVSTLDEPDAFTDFRYVMATYALAPRVVVRGIDGVRYVLAFYEDEPSLAALCARYRLAPVATALGVALTVREEAR